MGSNRCENCNGPVIEIEVSSGGSSLVMRSCGACDSREWEAGGRRLGLAEVLEELASAEGRQGRRRS